MVSLSGVNSTVRQSADVIGHWSPGADTLETRPRMCVCVCAHAAARRGHEDTKETISPETLAKERLAVAGGQHIL